MFDLRARAVGLVASLTVELESEVSVKSDEFIIEGGRRTSERWVERERKVLERE